MKNAYSKIFWFAIAAILVFTPVARGAVRLWSVTPVLLISYFLIFVELWRVNNLKDAHGPRAADENTLDKPIIVFCFLAVISFIFSIYKHDSFYALLCLFGYIGIYYIVLNNFDRIMRKRLMGLIIFMGALLSAYGLFQYFGLLKHSWWIPRDFLAATYVNHNHFAGYLELIIPLTVGWLMRRKTAGNKQKIALTSALIVMVAAFIGTQSRGAWISLGISLFVMDIVLVKKKMLWKSSLIIFLLISATVFSLAYLNEGSISKRIDTIKNAEVEEASLQTRLQIWRGTVDMIKHSPLIGVGIGDYIWGFPRFSPEGLNVQANFAHNDYLQMAAEMGLLAPLIMLWFLLIVIRRGAGVIKKSISPVKLGCSIGMLSIALHGMVDFNFHIAANMIVFTVYAAFIMASSGSKEENSLTC